MPVTRRELLRLAAAAPAGFAVTSGMAALGRAISQATASLRPAAAGTSATRCACCGATDHTMLDSRCPAAKRVI